MGDISRLGLNAQIIDTKRSQPVVKTTLEEAIKFAEDDAGEEAIIQTGDNEFTVVDLKDKTGAEALFDPAGGTTPFSSAMIIRKNNRAEVVAPLIRPQSTPRPSSGQQPRVSSMNSTPPGSPCGPSC